MKTLNDILKQASDTIRGVRASKTEPLSLGKDPGVDYDPKSPADREFVARHSVQKWDDPNGNKSNIFQASNIKHVILQPDEERHGWDPKEAKKVNEATAAERTKVAQDTVAKKLASPIEPNNVSKPVTPRKGPHGAEMSKVRHLARQAILNLTKTNEDIESVQEKHLTPAETEKREEIAQAIERRNPKMPVGKKMAIATAQAKKVAEDYSNSIAGSITTRENDKSAERAKTQLRAICSKVTELIDNIPDEMIIDPSVQSDIAEAIIKINNVHDCVMYRKEPNKEQADIPMTFPNMNNGNAGHIV